MLKDEEPDRWMKILPETGPVYKMTETDPLAVASFIGGVLLIGPSAILAGLTSIIRIHADKYRIKGCGWALSGILLATGPFLYIANLILTNLSWMD